MKMRRLTMAFLLALVVGLLSVTALAADTNITSGGTYDIESGTVTIGTFTGDVTLNLNGVTIDAIDASGLTGDLTINLSGSNKITTSGVGIQVKDGQNLTIQGDGTLYITAGTNGITGTGTAIFTNNASVNVKASGAYGITGFATVTISGTYTQVIAEGTTAAIHATTSIVATDMKMVDENGDAVTIAGGALEDGSGAVIKYAQIGQVKVSSSPKRYILTVIEGEGGEISPFRGFKYSISKGRDSNDFKFTPDEGYEIYDVLVDGESIGAVTGYQFIDIRTNHTLEVQFAPGSSLADLDDTDETDEIDAIDGNEEGTYPLSDVTDPYVIGYEDGTFAPDADITRAETATVFSRMMDEEMDEEIDYVSDFEDVSADLWYSQQVAFLESLDIVIGYEDNTFRGDNAITRAEYAAVASRFADLELTEENVFADVADDHWAVAYINAAVANGWLVAKADGTFAPEETMTRAEVVVLFNALMGRTYDEAAGLTENFSDVEPDHWAYGDIVVAVNPVN
ncbi:MAG: S-layer homology domain-containing protein [Eubacteriales bacterium]